MKECNICNERKELNEYYNQKGTPDNKRYSCKKCWGKINRKYEREYDKGKFTCLLGYLGNVYRIEIDMGSKIL